jgi:hypothetical protein
VAVWDSALIIPFAPFGCDGVDSPTDCFCMIFENNRFVVCGERFFRVKHWAYFEQVADDC